MLSPREHTFNVTEQSFAHNGEVQITIPGNTRTLRCGIIGLGWSMWLLAVRGLSFTPCWFLNFSTTSHFSRGQGENFPVFTLNATVPLSLSEVDIVLTDLATVRHDGFNWSGLQCHAFVVAGRLRRVPEGWFAFRMPLSHQQVGGVSDAAITFHLLSQNSAVHERFSQIVLPSYPNCTVDSLIDCTVTSGRQWASAAAPHSCISPQEVYPWRSDPLVLCPAVLGKPYRVRKLSLLERCAVADIPSGFVVECRPDLTRLLSFVHFPLKLYTVCLQHLFFYDSMIAGGGCF